MKRLIACTLAIALAAGSTLPAAAKSRYRVASYDEPAMAKVTPASDRFTFKTRETHDTIRAQAADPTHQYDLPDWARAALSGRGRR